MQIYSASKSFTDLLGYSPSDLTTRFIQTFGLDMALERQMSEANERATAFYTLVLTDNEAAKALPPFEFDVSGAWRVWPVVACTTLATPSQVRGLVLRLPLDAGDCEAPLWAPGACPLFYLIQRLIRAACAQLQDHVSRLGTFSHMILKGQLSACFARSAAGLAGELPAHPSRLIRCCHTLAHAVA